MIKNNYNENKHKDLHYLKSILDRKSHIIWDWNGTLLDDRDHALNVVNVLLERYELNKISKETYWELFRFPIQSFYESIGFDFRKISMSQLSQEFVTLHKEGLNSCGIYPHSMDIIQHNIKNSKTQSVLSATDQNSLNFALENFNLKSYFKYIYGLNNFYAASKVELGKDLIEKNKLPTSSSIIIGDTDHDLEVGQKLGIDVVLIANGHQNYPYLSGLHDLVFELV